MRIDSVAATPQKAELMELLKNLNIGDLVKGRILELADGNVTIKTSGGQVLTAALLQNALTSNIELQKGAFIELMINNISSDKIIASINDGKQPVMDVQQKLGEMLSKMNLPVSEKNIEAALLLVKYNMPVTKENIAHVVNMQKNAASLSQSSSEGAFGLLLSELDIQNTPVNVLNKLTLTAEPEVRNLLQQLEAAVSSNKTDEAAATDSKLVIPQKDAEVPETIIRADAVKPDITKVVASDNRAVQSNTSEATQPEDVSTSNNTAKQLVQILNKMDIEITSDIKQLIESAVKALSSAGKNNLEKVAFLISKEIEVTPKNLETIDGNLNKTNTISVFLEKLDKQVNVLEAKGVESKELKAVKEEIQKLFLQPRQLENSENIEEQTKAIIKLGEKLESLLSHKHISDPEIQNTLSNLKDNVDFIRQVNNYSNYLQIPVMINEQKTTAEVYVFKDAKRTKKIDPQNAMVLIALDLQNIGHLESMIQVVGKTVNVTFRVEDSKIGDLFSKKADNLQNSLEAKGYRLNPVKVIKLSQAFNLISLEEMLNEKNIDNLHFDKRI